MSRKNDANKYWIYGEDAALAARFTKYLTKVLYARRASYIRDKMVEVSREISIEDCSGEVDDVYGRLTAPIEERVEAKLMWEGIVLHRCVMLFLSTADRGATQTEGGIYLWSQGICKKKMVSTMWY